MPDNSVLSARCQFLMQGISLCQSNTGIVNANFKDAAKGASAAIDQALHNNGLQTTQDLADLVAKELPAKERDQYIKLIKQNKLPTIWESLIGKDTAEHINKATDLLGGLIGIRGLMQIKNGLAFDMSPGFSYITTMSRASAMQVAATEAFAKHVSKVAQINTLNENIALNEIVGNEATQLRAELQTAMNEELVLAEQSYTLRTAAFEATSVATGAEAELIAARTAASASLRSGIYGAVIGAGILVGCWLYSRHEEAEQAKALKDAIRRLAASRLFAQATLHKSETFAGLMIDIKHLADHYSPNPDTYKSRLDDLVEDLKTNQADDLPKAFAELKKEDEAAQPPTDTSEDPKTVDDLERIHREMVEKYLKDLPNIPLVQM